MARKKTIKPVEKTPKKKTAPKFSIERLGEDCQQLFGVGITTYAGATYGLRGEYTVEEMKQIIDAWKGKEVK